MSPLTPLTPLTLDLVSQRRLAEVATEELAMDALLKLCAMGPKFVPLDDVATERNNLYYKLSRYDNDSMVVKNVL